MQGYIIDCFLQSKEAVNISIELQEDDIAAQSLYYYGLSLSKMNSYRDLKEFKEQIEKVIQRHQHDKFSVSNNYLHQAHAIYYICLREFNQALALETKVLRLNKTFHGDTALETIDSYKRTGLLEFKIGLPEAAPKLRKYASSIPHPSTRRTVIEMFANQSDDVNTLNIEQFTYRMGYEAFLE